MHPRRLLPILLVGLLALAGCDTIPSRIRQKAEVFASLPPADQERLRRGEIAVGDTSDMVFIAIGAPTRQRQVTTATGNRSEWIYREYYETYDGMNFAGYRRMVGFDRRTGRRFVYLEPTYADVYHERSEERLRITFEDGRVSAIEEIQR